MSELFKRMKAWAPLLKLGNTVSRRNELERYSRFLVLDSIKRAQILDYLKIPRTLDELVKHFEWEYPSKYVDDLMKILVDDKVIFHKKGRFVINYNIHIEKPNVKFIEDFNEVFKIYASGIPNRLKGEYFEYTGRLALFKWDSVLAGQIYQALRDSAWNFINPVDIAGSKLLDVGCGPGYETADLWVRLQSSKTEITAIDNDKDLLTIAREEFCQNIRRWGYPDTTWDQLENPPTFIHGSVDDMSMFDDETFDTIYFSNFLHWLEEPINGIREMFRVLKPGGLIFGSQGTSEVTNPYLDITARVIKGTYGYFSKEQFMTWFKEVGFSKIKSATMVNTFKAWKPK
ncbi:MAG: class I SAM-dependent methyltransferase [Candidatus Heimdallarchaeota archaeon]|nr:class I SAM-dependent methyltransferase [Candidatus Heimdallarchaeota archaeon]